MFAVSAKSSSSVAEPKLAVIWTVAPESCVESGSLTAVAGSTATGPSPSV